MATLSIIGISGYGKDIIPDHSLDMFECMIQACKDQIQEWKLQPDTVTLVSGGCSWADHVAVDLFINNPSRYKGLVLYLPCNFKESFEDTGESHWAKNPGKVLNNRHYTFSKAIGRDTLNDITKAIKIGAGVVVKNGFHARNSLVAKSDYVIAITAGDEIVGGTLDTWNKAKSACKMQLIISN